MRRALLILEQTTLTGERNNLIVWRASLRKMNTKTISGRAAAQVTLQIWT